MAPAKGCLSVPSLRAEPAALGTPALACLEVLVEIRGGPFWRGASPHADLLRDWAAATHLHSLPLASSLTWETSPLRAGSCRQSLRSAGKKPTGMIHLLPVKQMPPLAAAWLLRKSCCRWERLLCVAWTMGAACRREPAQALSSKEAQGRRRELCHSGCSCSGIGGGAGLPRGGCSGGPPGKGEPCSWGALRPAQHVHLWGWLG